MDRPEIQEPPQAGPSSLPASASTLPDPSRPLRRPGSHGRLAKLMIPGRSRSGSTASQADVAPSVLTDESPTVSGRTTPEQRWRSNKAATASLLASDAKYKKFAAQVDKCLQSFESVNEWADFISFLSRLLKTLQTPSPPYTEIPRKLVVAKRLAQCLNPALPSGVHQRALDVYAHIFASIGVDGLKRDLLIWSSGLFPFFQFAATSVRPILLSLYEKFYLPLEADLRPVTKALILALLPGMEEETGDFFDKVLSILSRISQSVGATFFLQNVFLVLISSSSSRLSGINFLSKRLAKPPEVESGIDIGLVIRGVSAVLEDENSLVRRGGLDLLLRTLPLDGPLLKETEEADRRLLVRAAVGVVLQREISLTRRVYTWLLGPSETAEEQSQYFKDHGLELLSSTLAIDMDQTGTDSLDAQRPYKVFLSLLDKWEIGSILSEKLAVYALKAIKRNIDASTLVREEFLMTASAVYDAVEPIIIWRAFDAGLQQHDDALLWWTLATLPQKDQEVTDVHIPVMLDQILTRRMAAQDASRSISLASALLDHVPSAVFSRSPASMAEETDATVDAVEAPSLAVVVATSDRVANEVIPRVVRAVFELAADRHATQNSLVLLRMASKLIDIEAIPIGHLEGSAWLQKLIKRLASTESFPLVDAIVTTALKASQCTLFQPPLSLTTPHIMQTILDNLFRFLHPNHAVYHIRAVELLWEYNRLAEVHMLDNVIARQMTDCLSKRSGQAMDGFGTIWRLTEDAMLPGEIFHVPMSLLMDSLRDRDPIVRGAAESWLRVNLVSYFRILDPILSRLIDPTGDDGDVAVQDIDYTSLIYLARSLETIISHGAKELSKTCQSTKVSTSTHPALARKAQAIASESGTYLDLLVSVLVSHLRDPMRIRTSDRNVLVQLQASILDVLQILLSHGDISRPSTIYLKSALLDKLSTCVKRNETILQPQLLRLLRSASASTPAETHQRSGSLAEKSARHDVDDFDKQLAHVIVDGVSSPCNRKILQHWVDYVVAVAPSLSASPELLQTLCDCFSLRLRSVVIDLGKQYAGEATAAIVTDVEVTSVLAGLEMLITLSGSHLAGGKSEDGRVGSEGGSGILGLVSGVFISDAPDEKPKSRGAEHVATAIEALLVAWSISTPKDDSTPSGPGRTASMQIVRSHVRQALEKLFKTQTSLVVASCIAIWASSPVDVADDAIFDCIDTLTPSAQRVVEIVSDSVKQSRSSEIVDQATMSFLESYISRLEAPIAVQIWSTMFGFAREMLAGATTPGAKAGLYPLLRCLNVLCRIVVTTSALEDRRLRRDLQDVYPKVLDAVVTNATKIPSAFSRQGAEGDQSRPDQEDDLDTVRSFIAQDVIPYLRPFLVDADRITSACSSISLNMVAPSLKQHRADRETLHVVLELTKLPPATKAWRILLGDAFNDGRFFAIGLEDVGMWKPLICALMDSDKERFPELLGRITAAPSANIFTNREQEMISRSSNLRRLSFVLLAADQNHYLTQLPAIQEKLVDILRTNVVSPRVHSEVYLCLRVMMCRISSQHLTNFWPVILAELLRVFEGLMGDIPEDESESLQLALAACKFLDLLLVIQSEDFQVHQWIFVTDTTDAVYPPEDFTPEAIMDTLAEILREHSHVVKGDILPLEMAESNDMRRPRLARVKAISSLRQLEPFFSRGSIDTFEGVYRDAGVDWAAVEDGLCGEIFG